MVIRRILRWFGIIVTSICFGALAMIPPWIFQNIAIPALPDRASSLPVDSMTTPTNLAWLGFIWGGVLCLAVITLGPKIRFNLLFAHGMATLCFCLYSIDSLINMTRQIESPRIWLNGLELVPYVVTLTLFEFIGLIFLLSALIAAKDADQESRFRNRKLRNSISDGQRPPLH
jgi:hypothetical protein